MIRAVVCMLFLLVNLNIYAQNLIIKGTIKDIENETIISASVILKDNTGKIITYTYTNELGTYNLNTDKLGQFVLIASAMGFEQKSVDIVIKDKNETKTIDFFLTPKVKELKEIIIDFKRP